MLKEGLKNKAFTILLDAFVFLKLKLNKSPLNFFYKILKKIKPLVELKNLKMGSNKYLIPTPLTPSRQFLLSVIFY
jgi:ribosomal protein S7